MLRRLHHDQPAAFSFTPANQVWAEGQIAKYPEGRQASAIIPLLWRAQEQEGWLTRPAIEHIADMLGMARIRALEVATFYYMFQLRPVGDIAHVQVCGTLSCMLCGAEDLVGVCKERIARKPFELSADGMLSWEEVECLGACSNAPMVQIGKDYYEDLDETTFGWILAELRAGRVPPPGSYKGRFSSEPAGGPTTLIGDCHHKTNGSVGLALQIGDTVRRIDGTEPAFSFGLEPEAADRAAARAGAAKAVLPTDAAEATAPTVPVSTTTTTAAPDAAVSAGQRVVADEHDTPAVAPLLYETAPEEVDDLQRLKGVGPKLATTLNELGIYRFDQIAAWDSAEIAWIDARLKFKGRVARDDWVGQARHLAAAGTEG